MVALCSCNIFSLKEVMFSLISPTLNLTLTKRLNSTYFSSCILYDLINFNVLA
jgi:hypothetical protein